MWAKIIIIIIITILRTKKPWEIFQDIISPRNKMSVLIDFNKEFIISS